MRESADTAPYSCRHIAAREALMYCHTAPRSDYGNSEVNDRDDGPGAMEAIYFGNAHWHGNTGAGSTGPWVGADLESGMY
eukprot:SAG31_NODE_27994_length_417_cov_0.622642_1_plen_80_part_00